MGDKGWKQFERKIARAHGCERAGPTGTADVDSHSIFSIEAKLQNDVPKYLDDCMAQAVSHLKNGYAKIPIVIMKRPRRPMTAAFVLIRYNDWLGLHGK